MALRRAIRSLKKAGPGLLRRPSARSSGLSQTGLGAAAALIGTAIKTDTNARRRTEHGLGIRRSSRAVTVRAVTQFVQRHNAHDIVNRAHRTSRTWWRSAGRSRTCATLLETRDAAVTCLKSWSKCTRNPAPAAYQVYVKPY